MLIVLEGADGAGKTTLAREIVAQLPGSRVLHAGPLPKSIHPLTMYEGALRSYRPGGDDHIICDRWHLGEAVYPQVLRRSTRWNDAVERHLRLFMRARGAYVVLLDPPTSELKTRLETRGDDLVSTDMLDAIAFGFIRLAERGNVDDVVTQFVTPRRIINNALAAERAAKALRPFETYVGPPRPLTLLFGEKRGVGGKFTHQRMPSFMPYPGTSGHYLLSHMRDTVTVGLANACDADDPRELWKALGEPQVVALGRCAHDELTHLGVQHGAVPHPQFVRRFHHRHGDEYAQLIYAVAQTQEDRLSWRP